MQAGLLQPFCRPVQLQLKGSLHCSSPLALGIMLQSFMFPHPQPSEARTQGLALARPTLYLPLREIPNTSGYNHKQGACRPLPL